jgi:hypothetical protein
MVEITLSTSVDQRRDGSSIPSEIRAAHIRFSQRSKVRAGDDGSTRVSKWRRRWHFAVSTAVARPARSVLRGVV